MVSWTILVLLKLQMFRSTTSLNWILVSSTYSHLSNLQTVEMVLMGMIKLLSTFFMQSNTQKTAKMVLQKGSLAKCRLQLFHQFCKLFILNLVSVVGIFCFATLSPNLFDLSMYLLKNFLRFLQFFLIFAHSSKCFSADLQIFFLLQCYIIFSCQFGWIYSAFRTERLYL